MGGRDRPRARAPEWSDDDSAVTSSASVALRGDGGGGGDDGGGGPDPWIGQVVGGRFKIVEPLGAGGMAVVYRAQEQGLIKREVAVKLLHPESALSQATLGRFLKEAQLIADLRHPNVVQVIDVGRTGDGHLYLAMELLVGATLNHVVRDAADRGEPFTWERLAPIVLQICSALKVAHAARVVHRDIKPSNCFCIEVDGDPDFVKLLDFGIAKAQLGAADEATPLTQEGMFVGTPHYAAPEAIVQRPEWPIDGRADIFALGVMMYLILTGSLPWQGLDKLDVLYKTVHERPPSPRERAPRRGIPVEVDELVMTAMATDPRERFENVAALARAIRGTLQRGAAPTTTSGQHGVLRTGSITDLRSGGATPTPAPVATTKTRERPSVIVAPRDGEPTPLPGDTTTAAQSQPPATLSEPAPALRTGGSSRATLAAVILMTLGLIGLVALLVHELTPKPLQPAPPLAAQVEVPPADGRTARLAAPAAARQAPVKTVEEPTRAAEGEPAKVPVNPRAGEAPVNATASPDPPEKSTQLDPSPPAKSSQDTPKPESGPQDPPKPTPAADPMAARKQQIRERVRKVARSVQGLACLPPSVLIGDGVADELPVSITVEADGRTRAVAKGTSKRRVPTGADACVLALFERERFPAAEAAVTVPLTVNFE